MTPQTTVKAETVAMMVDRMTTAVGTTTAMTPRAKTTVTITVITTVAGLI